MATSQQVVGRPRTGTPASLARPPQPRLPRSLQGQPGGALRKSWWDGKSPAAGRAVLLLRGVGWAHCFLLPLMSPVRGRGQCPSGRTLAGLRRVWASGAASVGSGRGPGGRAGKEAGGKTPASAGSARGQCRPSPPRAACPRTQGSHPCWLSRRGRHDGVYAGDDAEAPDSPGGHPHSLLGELPVVAAARRPPGPPSPRTLRTRQALS